MREEAGTGTAWGCADMKGRKEADQSDIMDVVDHGAEVMPLISNVLCVFLYRII